MDQRTLDLLIDRGVIDEERVTAKATHRHCRSCRRVVLAALADDGPGVTGIRTTLDPRPVTPLGELMALTAGLATYARIGNAITWRCIIRIRTSIPGQKYDVHHEHRCIPPPGIEYAPSIQAAAFTAPLHDEIPY